MKIVNVVGARPNFMKIAPLMTAYRKCPRIRAVLVHTGQHYDERMSELFFRQLEIPQPDVNLGVGGASQAVQTARIMTAFEPVVLEHKPDAVLVVGDVNSTIACGLVAVKLGVKLVHVEAGLRSFDRTMPEEINRVLTDAISDLLFCTEQSAVDNLAREGVGPEKVFLVGNVMIDTLLKNLDKAQASTILKDLDLVEGGYAVLTLHRPANVDDPAVLGGILDALEVIQREVPVVFPVHPRTRKNLTQSGSTGVPPVSVGGTGGTPVLPLWGRLSRRIAGLNNLRLIDPAGYLDFLKLMASAQVVLTDSGGIQEETTILNVPCLTLRDNTERPITVQVGSNRLVGTEPEKILSAWRELRAGRMMSGTGFQPVPAQLKKLCHQPPLWDGHAAERIVDILVQALEGPASVAAVDAGCPQGCNPT